MGGVLISSFDFLIGVDGGGTGTRVSVTSPDGKEFARGSSGPSGLAHGIDSAWASVLTAVSRAFAEFGQPQPPLERMAIGLGLAGVHNKQWASEFVAQNPGFGELVLETDGFTSLLGAHAGQAGAIVAVGTGIIGEALLPDGTRREVSGWGFPCGDEASGAWIGLQAVNYLQRVYDGRASGGKLAESLQAVCGTTRDALQIWLGAANQTTYAQLAPVVIAHAADDENVQKLLVRGATEIAEVAHALDPSEQLPLALCGGLVKVYTEYLPAALKARIVEANADSSIGAVWLIRHRLQGTQSC